MLFHSSSIHILILHIFGIDIGSFVHLKFQKSISFHLLACLLFKVDRKIIVKTILGDICHQLRLHCECSYTIYGITVNNNSLCVQCTYRNLDSDLYLFFFSFCFVSFCSNILKSYGQGHEKRHRRKKYFPKSTLNTNFSPKS